MKYFLLIAMLILYGCNPAERRSVPIKAHKPDSANGYTLEYYEHPPWTGAQKKEMRAVGDRLERYILIRYDSLDRRRIEALELEADPRFADLPDSISAEQHRLFGTILEMRELLGDTMITGHITMILPHK